MRFFNAFDDVTLNPSTRLVAHIPKLRSHWLRYGFAVLVVGVATAVAYGFNLWFGSYFFLLLGLAIAVTTP